jgi:HTH-type transcriptional repressor of NAD biosynthesis genes
MIQNHIFPKKFVFIGPESSGKSTICLKLVDILKTDYIPEVCRLMAETILYNNTSAKIDFNFTIEDFISMAHMQNMLESTLDNKNKILICDNDTFALTIWCERYLHKYHDEIFTIYNNATYLNNRDKIYILLKPNVPFVQDGYRDGEHIREWMFERFKSELDSKNMKYYIIDSPDYEVRYKNCLHIISNYMDE